MCEGVIEHHNNLPIIMLMVSSCPMINLKESRNCNMRSSIDCVHMSLFVLLELVKNAISSTLLQSQVQLQRPVPPIDVILESTDAYGEGLRGKTLLIYKFVHNVKR